MRNLWKSAVAIIAISASLSTGLAGGSTVKAHDAAVVPVAPSVVYGLQFRVPCNLSASQLRSHPGASKCWGFRFMWSISSVSANPANTRYQFRFLYQGGKGGGSSPIWRIGFVCGDPSSTYARAWDFSENKSIVMNVGAFSNSRGVATCEGTLMDFGLTGAEPSGAGGGGVYLDTSSTQTTWLTASNSPTVSAVTVLPRQASLIASWAASTGDTPEIIFDGYYDVVATPPTGRTATCRTRAHTCAVTGLDPSTPYTVTVSSETNFGAINPTGPSYSVYPVAGAKLAVKAIPLTFSKNLTVLAYGAVPRSVVKVGIPGQKITCTANAVGQCLASLKASKTGSWSILAQSGSQTATASAWYPALNVSAGVRHGMPFTVSVASALPNSPVVLKLSDSRTIKATTSTAGGVVVSVKTTKADFLTVNVSISGTTFGPYEVQVS